MALQLTGEQIRTITSSSYYHLKHYHELGGDNVGKWLQKIESVRDRAQGHLIAIISAQKAKEQARLSQIFQGSCSVQSLQLAGFTEASAAQFYSAFQRGKTGATIEEQVAALNDLLSVQIITENQANGNGLQRAAEIISRAFSDSGQLTSEKISDLDEYFTFISALYQTAVALEGYAQKEEGAVAQALYAAVRKLNGALSHYKADYSQRAGKTQAARQEVENLFVSMDNFITAHRKKSWTRHKTDEKTFDNVQAVIQHSASGFLKQSGGGSYERAAAEEMLGGFQQIFASTRVQVSESGATVVGGKTDKLGKAQKADIALTFSLTSTAINQEQFNITFSVKKKEGGGSIQIHHGGSLFAYANRFSAMGGAIGEDFDFLKEDGNFQYVYVNELREGGRDGDFLMAFRRMLEGVGFLFLGEEVEGMGGADFLFIQGKIYAFSTILEKIKQDPNAFTITVGGNRRDMITEKSALIKGKYKDSDEFYSDSFIQDSIKLGQTAIYGTQFSINLKSSYK